MFPETLTAPCHFLNTSQYKFLVALHKFHLKVLEIPFDNAQGGQPLDT